MRFVYFCSKNRHWKIGGKQNIFLVVRNLENGRREQFFWWTLFNFILFFFLHTLQRVSEFHPFDSQTSIKPKFVVLLLQFNEIEDFKLIEVLYNPHFINWYFNTLFYRKPLQSSYKCIQFQYKIAQNYQLIVNKDQSKNSLSIWFDIQIRINLTESILFSIFIYKVPVFGILIKIFRFSRILFDRFEV